MGKLAVMVGVVATAGFASVGLAAVATAGDDPAEVVRQAYKIEISGFSSVGVAGTAPWDSPNREVLFSPRLSQLFATDERYMQDSGEMGNLDFDPFLNGQDGEIKALKVTTKSQTGDKAVVEASFDSFDSRQVIQFELVEDKGDWRIDDIIDPLEDGQSVSVANLLSQPYRKNP